MMANRHVLNYIQQLYIPYIWFHRKGTNSSAYTHHTPRLAVRMRPQTRLSASPEDSGPEACHHDGPCYMWVSAAFKSETTGPGTELGGGAQNAGELIYCVGWAPERRVHIHPRNPASHPDLSCLHC